MTSHTTPSQLKTTSTIDGTASAVNLSSKERRLHSTTRPTQARTSYMAQFGALAGSSRQQLWFRIHPITQEPALMLRKSKSRMPDSGAKDLWINPRSNRRGPHEDHTWDNRGSIAPNSGARFLELADIALGAKKTARKKRTAGCSGSVSETGKSEPYSS